jgi:hypothetical protein
MRFPRPTRLAASVMMLLACVTVFCLVTGAGAEGYNLDRLGNPGWSPDSKSVAFNWPERPELFVISMKTGASFFLKPVGNNFDVEGGQVFSTQAKTGDTDPHHTSYVVASPGRDTLTLLEWSTNSAQFAYRAGMQTNALFSVVEGIVTSKLPASEVLPWHKKDELRMAFDFVAPSQDRPERYWTRVETLGGSVIKQINFEDPREVRRMMAVRYHDTSFLSADHEFVLYPRVTSDGWQIMREPLTGSVTPQAVTKPDSREPYQWQLSGDNRFLALVEGDVLMVGALDDWEHAKTIKLPRDSVSISWSPDGRFLGLLDRRSLYVLPRDGDELKLVTENCAQRFWGWRGTRLFFGDARTDLTDLSCIDAEHLGPPTRILRARQWETATRNVWLSPDGTRLVCLVADIDDVGRAVWQLWESAVQTNAQWQLMYELKPQ